MIPHGRDHALANGAMHKLGSQLHALGMSIGRPAWLTRFGEGSIGKDVFREFPTTAVAVAALV